MAPRSRVEGYGISDLRVAGEAIILGGVVRML